MKIVKTVYCAYGAVIGNCWRGGMCGYGSKHIKADSYQQIIEKIRQSFGDGSLDGGFGFESLVSAKMTIKKIEMTDSNFIRESFTYRFFGDKKIAKKYL